jgi:Putative restriction endonuclease
LHDFAYHRCAGELLPGLRKKLGAFERNGVREYVIWRVFDQEIDWFVLREGRFNRLAPSADGIVRSTVFPGLWLGAAALLRGDLYAVLAVVQQGVSSPDHAEFVARLEQSRVR